MESSDFSASAFISKISTPLKQRFSILLAALFILWTPILIGTTVKAQNSCQPLVNWTNTLPKICETPDAPKPKPEPIIEPDQHIPRDVVGALAGTAAVGVAAVAGAPAVAIAGAGIAVWFIVRTVLGD